MQLMILLKRWKNSMKSREEIEKKFGSFGEINLPADIDRIKREEMLMEVLLDTREAVNRMTGLLIQRRNRETFKKKE